MRLMRAPVGLYRAGLGRLLGRRMLLLEHTGRRTGAARYAVLEVIGRPGPGRYLVASGFGDSADWLRNVRAEPAVRVTVGGGPSRPARAEILPVERAREVLRRYAREHAVAWRALRPLLARLAPGVAGDPDELAGRLPVVELTLLD
jgi:deazaflavin-dependent oxidoreductase (nitroreductase family)